MSTIDPPAGWDDVDGIDTNERLLGGPDGALNRAVTGLTARTKQLHEDVATANQAVAATNSQLADLTGALGSAAFSAAASFASAAQGAAADALTPQVNVLNTQVDTLLNAQQTSALYKATLADLQAVTGSYVSQGAFVTNGAEAGTYSWSGSAWQFLRADTSIEIQNQIKLVPATNVTLSVWSEPSVTRQAGYVINKDTGVVSPSANFWYAWAPLTGNEVRLRVTASLSQPVQALAVYKDASGNYLGYEVAGTTTETLYTDYVLQNVPPLARSVHVSSRRDNIAIGTRNLQSDIAARVASSEVAVVSMQAALAPVKQTVSDWTPQIMTSVTGAYVDKTTGAQVTSSAYNYKYMSLSGAEGTLQFTTYVTGTTTVPVIFYNAAGAVIGTFGNVSTQYNNQAVAVPALARKVAVTARDGNPIDVKLQVVAPEIAKRLATVEARVVPSRWSGTLSASFGDSLVGQNRWQPLVASVHGNVDTNCGVGGSKISKPDASPTVVSMCDDARVNAIPSASQLVLFEGGTNDWAQSVPLGSFDSSSDTEFYGALHVTFAKLLARFPASRIFCITSPYGERITVPGGWANGWTNTQGLTIRDYADAMRKVANFYGIPVIDWSRECGWSHSNAATYLDDDGAYFHPSVATGAPQLAQIVIGRLWDIQRRT